MKACGLLSAFWLPVLVVSTSYFDLAGAVSQVPTQGELSYRMLLHLRRVLLLRGAGQIRLASLLAPCSLYGCGATLSSVDRWQTMPQTHWRQEKEFPGQVSLGVPTWRPLVFRFAFLPCQNSVRVSSTPAPCSSGCLDVCLPRATGLLTSVPDCCLWALCLVLAPLSALQRPLALQSHHAPTDRKGVWFAVRLLADISLAGEGGHRRSRGNVPNAFFDLMYSSYSALIVNHLLSRLRLHEIVCWKGLVDVHSE